MAPPPPALILASTSPYRREVLERLRLPFTVVGPGVDETPRPGEAPAALAARLALEKARAVAARFKAAAVIGADQVCDLDGAALGKPGHAAAAAAQLRRLSGRTAVFQTAVAVCPPGAADAATVVTVPVEVRFRRLSAAEIARYLSVDQPYDCAGSAKVESLGIALLERVVSDDPTALIGLPLIALCRLLRAAGIDPLGAPPGDGA